MKRNSLTSFAKYDMATCAKNYENLIYRICGQTMLAKIADRLTKEGYDFTILMIGSLKYQDLVNEIKSYSCPNIYILGEKNNPLEYLKMADAFCLSSIYEGMPITLIECFSVGAVPLCTPVGGIVNMIKDGENGLLAKSSSQEDIEKMLKQYICLNSKTITYLQQNSLKTFSKFNMNTCTNNYLSLIK